MTHFRSFFFYALYSCALLSILGCSRTKLNLDEFTLVKHEFPPKFEKVFHTSTNVSLDTVPEFYCCSKEYDFRIPKEKNKKNKLRFGGFYFREVKQGRDSLEMVLHLSLPISYKCINEELELCLGTLKNIAIKKGPTLIDPTNNATPPKSPDRSIVWWTANEWECNQGKNPKPDTVEIVVIFRYLSWDSQKLRKPTNEELELEIEFKEGRRFAFIFRITPNNSGENGNCILTRAEEL